MSDLKDYTDILGELCDSSDDCVWAQNRGTQSEVQESEKRFESTWNNAVDYFSSEIEKMNKLKADKAELVEMLNHVAANMKYSGEVDVGAMLSLLQKHKEQQ